ncbi:MAG TPA: phosphatase [Firmicutes bacterium]|jgi:HAD superfamily hydrolase (TIGR01509 family)|nr:phosphatase [Bacillota bacterium]
MTLKVNPRARGLIFDFDGTLGDTMPTHIHSWQVVAERYHFEISATLLYQVAGMSTGDIVEYLNQHFGYQLDVATIVKAKNEAYLQFTKKVNPIEPVLKIVQAYYGKMPMALGTGEYRNIALVNVKAAGVDRYFDILVTCDDVKKAKPDPETFLKCAELMKVAPEFCQVFEDAPPGLEAAARAGMIVTDVRPFINRISA